MNGYVAGGWAATSLMLAAYAWRTLRRGRLLRRALAPSPATPLDQAPR